jgi:hypothetical protein
VRKERSKELRVIREGETLEPKKGTNDGNFDGRGVRAKVSTHFLGSCLILGALLIFTVCFL